MPSPIPIRRGREAARELETLKQLHKDGLQHRKPFEAEWFLNIAFFQGEQWWAWAESRFARPKLEPWRMLFTDNRVQPAVLQEVARLTRELPTWDAEPTNPDDDALKDALLANRVLRAKWDDLKVQPLLRRATFWSRICGLGALKVTWDPLASDTGAEVAVDQNGDPIVNPQDGQLIRRDSQLGEQLTQGGVPVQWEYVGNGDVRFNVRSPLDLVFDPLAGDEGIRSAGWVIEEAVRSPDEVQRRYGLDNPPKADASASAGLVESRMPGGRPDSSPKVGVKVCELWERPTLKYPKGRHVAWTDSTILAYEENDTPDHDLPYVLIPGIPVPGRFYPTSMTTQIRPLNMELNKTRSQMRENAARIGNPGLIVPQDTDVKIKGIPGEVIEFDFASANGALPQFLEMPSLPAYIREEPALIQDAIDKVSRQTEVSRGVVPAGVTAASAIQLLQEADQTVIGLAAQDFEQAVSDAGNMAWKLICRYYKTDRIVKIAGDDEAWSISTFRADQLSRDVPTVRVKPGSMIPKSIVAKQARMDQILALFLQNGVPLDPVALGEYLRDYEVGGLERLVSGFTEDARQIAKENQRLQDTAAPLPPVNEWDNHPAHLKGHEQVMKSAAWTDEFDDAQRQRYAAHWQAHKQAIEVLQAQVVQQAAAQQLAGMGPKPGQEPQGGPSLVPGGAQGQIVPSPGGSGDATSVA